MNELLIENIKRRVEKTNSKDLKHKAKYACEILQVIKTDDRVLPRIIYDRFLFFVAENISRQDFQRSLLWLIHDGYLLANIDLTVEVNKKALS